MMFVFPDPIEYEHSIHFIMAQRPRAKRILLIGGNPTGDIPELLKYPVERLVHVELDAGVGRMIRKVMADEYDRIFADPRVDYVPEDAARFVRKCGERFDVVLIKAPEPTTAGANRMYTLEFYRNIDRILARGGFMYTAVSSSVRLQPEAADLGASIYRTLKEVFPVVLVTAESRNRFFARRSATAENLTFDRETLFSRSRSANLETEFFRPEYFLGADEIAPAKTRYVEETFSVTEVPLNTNLRPVTYFYNLLLWSRFSGSKMKVILESAKRLSHGALGRVIVAGGIVCLLFGVVARCVRPWSRTGPGNRVFRNLSEGGWSRLMVGMLIATTGFCGMALEIVLIFVFQGLYGYVYTRMGLIVAMFMLGLVLGAPSGRILAGRSQCCCWLSTGAVELLLLVFALAVPKMAGAAFMPAASELVSRWSEAQIYAAVAGVGWAVGAEFPLGNRLFCDAGGTIGAAAAITDASDHMGAAVGCFTVGVVLVPVLGIAESCVALASLKFAGLLCLVSAVIAMPRRGNTGQFHTPGIVAPHSGHFPLASESDTTRCP